MDYMTLFYGILFGVSGLVFIWLIIIKPYKQYQKLNGKTRFKDWLNID